MPDAAPRTPVPTLHARPFTPGREGLIRRRTPRATDLRPPRVEGFEAGTARPRKVFARRSGARQAGQGFVNLERPRASPSRHPQEGLARRHEAPVPRALLAPPSLTLSSRFWERLTRGPEAPVWAFRHTVVNGGGRTILPGFATPSRDLCASPPGARSTSARVGGARV